MKGVTGCIQAAALALSLALAVALLWPSGAGAEVTTESSGGTIVVRGDEQNDRIAIACVDGLLQINGSEAVTDGAPCRAPYEFHVNSGAGRDRISFDEHGFPLNDLFVDAGPGADRVIGGVDGAVLLAGGPGSDVVVGGDASENIYGGSGSDLLRGGDGEDYLDGEGGRDRLYAGKGEDIVFGDRGSDRLRGGPSRDVLEGGPGPDRLSGGPGKDRCRTGPGRDRLRACERRSAGPILRRVAAVARAVGGQLSGSATLLR